MSKTQEMIDNLVVKNMKYADFIELYNIKPVFPEKIFALFQVLLSDFFADSYKPDIQVSQNDMNNILKNRNENLEAEVTQNREQLRSLNDMNASLRTQIEKLEEKLKENKEQLSSLNDLNVSLNTKKDDLEKEVKECKEELNAFSLKNSEDKKNKEIDSLSYMNESLKNQNSSLEEKLEQLKEKLNSLIFNNNSLQTKSNSLEEELKKYKEQKNDLNELKIFQAKNDNLEEELEKYREKLSNIKSYESEAMKHVFSKLPEFSKSALKIQTFWRGSKTRLNLPRYLALFRRKKTKMSLNPSEKIVFEIKKSLSRMNLTLENVYRASDIGGDGIITCEELSNFLLKLNLRVPKNHITKLIDLVDENSSGKIEINEFYDFLDAYSVSTEDHAGYLDPYKKRVLNKFKAKMQCSDIDIFSIFQDSADKSQVETYRLLEIFKEKLELLDREVQCLSQIFDAGRTGWINYANFKSVLIKTSDPNPESKPESSPFEKSLPVDKSLPSLEKSLSISHENNPIIKKFIETLKIYGLDPLSVYRFSNKYHADRLSSDDFFTGLKKLIPNVFELVSKEDLNLVIPNPLTQKIILSLIESNSESSRSEADDYWITRFSKLCKLKAVTAEMIFGKIDAKKHGKARFEDIKQGLMVNFTELADSESEMILKALSLETDKIYTFATIANILRDIIR